MDWPTGFPPENTGVSSSLLFLDSPPYALSSLLVDLVPPAGYQLHSALHYSDPDGASTPPEDLVHMQDDIG
jgi:hypothetical protein